MVTIYRVCYELAAWTGRWVIDVAADSEAEAIALVANGTGVARVHYAVRLGRMPAW